VQSRLAVQDKQLANTRDETMKEQVKYCIKWTVNGKRKASLWLSYRQMNTFLVRVSAITETKPRIARRLVGCGSIL
jgi:hypothetical protein